MHIRGEENPVSSQLDTVSLLFTIGYHFKKLGVDQGFSPASKGKQANISQPRYNFLKSLKQNPVNLRVLILFLFAACEWLPYLLKRQLK